MEAWHFDDIVGGALVDRAGEVQEADLGVRDGAVGEQVAQGRQQVVGQVRQELGPPAVVLALGLGRVDRRGLQPSGTR